jgi:hypothetical protein
VHIHHAQRDAASIRPCVGRLPALVGWLLPRPKHATGWGSSWRPVLKAPIASSKAAAVAETARRRNWMDQEQPRYKWVALSNTTLGALLAAINSSIVLISLPAIFRGIGLNPLAPGNVSYLRWILMGYLVVTAVLVVPLGRLGDIFGRVRIYTTQSSIRRCCERRKFGWPARHFDCHSAGPDRGPGRTP